MMWQRPAPTGTAYSKTRVEGHPVRLKPRLQVLQTVCAWRAEAVEGATALLVRGRGCFAVGRGDEHPGPEEQGDW